MRAENYTILIQTMLQWDCYLNGILSLEVGPMSFFLFSVKERGNEEDGEFSPPALLSLFNLDKSI